MPYSIVSKEEFKAFTNVLNAICHIPSRKTMTESRIPIMYKETKVNAKSIVYNISFKSFTTDCWIYGSNQPFLELLISLI